MARSKSPGEWMSHLPMVLLGLRSTIREDGEMSPADLVYGSALRLPGELLPEPASRSSVVPQGDFLRALHDSMRSALPMPITHHGRPPALCLPRSLDTASFVYVRIDAVRPPLVRPYEGPFRVVARDPKTFKLMRQGKPWIVSIDRLRPALGPVLDPARSAPRRDTVLSPSAPVFRPRSDAVPVDPISPRCSGRSRSPSPVPGAAGVFGGVVDDIDRSLVDVGGLGDNLHDLPDDVAGEDALDGAAVAQGVVDQVPDVPLDASPPRDVVTRSGRVSRPPQRYGFD